MPEIALPESVASTDPDLSSSVPFGSLRESQFTNPHLDRWQQSNSNSNNQQTTMQFQPQSLPVYASTGSGGIGSFFPESNDAASSERNRSMLNESSGIGGLLEGSRDGDNNNYYSRDIAGITNEYNQLTLDGPGRTYAESNGLQGNGTFDNGRPNDTNDEGNLSRSLTALDMLTRIRQTAPPLAPPSQLERSEGNVDSRSNSNLTGLIEQQQQFDGARPHADSNEQHYDADPDMFEAFDFELDE